MNQVTHHDFGLFQTESLSVDFISFNIDQITSLQTTRLASYFQNLGFNAYQKEIVQLQFPGISGKQFYQLMKQKDIQWQKFPNRVFSRLDLVYRRISKPNDPISNTEFINFSYIQFQKLYSSKKLASERNQKGLVLKIGNRRSSKHYRIYSNKKNNLLRFEAEMKGDLIKDFQDLFITSSFEEHQFESKIAYQFFKYSFELFSPLHQSSHIDWLAHRIRPYQYRNVFSLESAIHSHYLNQIDFKQIKEKQHLITLLKLLVFVRGLNYTPGQLTSKFRKYNFPLRKFLKFINKKTNQYQLNKTREFFDLVKKNFVIESFSDRHYRMLVTLPEVNLIKSQQNIWNVEIWVAEELFDYLHPFIFSDLFETKLSSHQFQVLFEIIKVYSSNDIRKEFHIQQFLDNYLFVLNGKQKKKIKEHFIRYLQVLNQQHKLRDKVIDLSSNKILNIQDLNTSHLNIAVFESIDIKFT